MYFIIKVIFIFITFNLYIIIELILYIIPINLVQSYNERTFLRLQ